MWNPRVNRMFNFVELRGMWNVECGIESVTCGLQWNVECLSLS
jgi:hypothetical protein